MPETTLMEEQAEQTQKSDNSESISKSTPKLKKRDLYLSLVQLISHNEAVRKALKLPKFPRKYFRVQIEPGVCSLLRVNDNNVCEYVKDSALEDDLLLYCNATEGVRSNFWISPGQARDTVRMFKAFGEMISEPPFVLWADEPGYCFNRLPWNKYRTLKQPYYHPTYDEIFSRMGNSLAFKIWFASLLIPESYTQQYVYLKGPGNDGKGSLVQIIERIFGPGFGSALAIQSEFQTAQFLGKRVIAFNDIDQTKFMSSGYFRSLCGGDSMLVNPKFQNGFTKKFFLKPIFTSNLEPEISSLKADIRRIIYCPFSENDIEPEGQSYVDRLWSETGDFLLHCLELYHEHCQNHQPIKVDNTLLDTAISDNEEDLEIFIEDYFEVNPNQYVIASQMQECFRERFGFDTKKHKKIKEYLARQGFRKIKITINGNRPWVYEGLKLLSPEQRRHFTQSRADASKLHIVKGKAYHEAPY